jgi:hypothetical protein
MNRLALSIHRWLGVVVCAPFLLWFSSGIGMMYWEFPSVSAGDRLERSASLDPSTIAIAPADAFRVAEFTEELAPTAEDRLSPQRALRTPRLKARAVRPSDVRLRVFAGRPAYIFRAGEKESIVYADTGERQRDVSQTLMARVAGEWVRRPSGEARVERIDIDQWTVEGSFSPLRPLWKYSWPNGEQVYVSQATGEVAQYTTFASRLGAYLGPIPHWLYFTPLRRHGGAWSAVVIGLSGAATLGALLGLFIGASVYSPRRRYRRMGTPSSNPYTGWKRWHLALGLLFGTAAASWAFSGLLSMEPLSFARPRGAPVPESLREAPDLPAFASKLPRVALAQLGARVKELECTSFAGRPIYLATLDGGAFRIVPLDGDPQAEFSASAIAAVVAIAAAPGHVVELERIARYDRYYIDRHHRLPLPVLVARFADPRSTRYYIDPRTAQVVSTYSSDRWTDRFLYHGLHSLDFPWLYESRPSWDIIVVAFMLGGMLLSGTAVMLASRVVVKNGARSQL